MQGKEPRPFTIEDYNKVISLKKLGLSQNQIKQKMGISTSTIWLWINTNRKPRFLYSKRKQRKLIEKAKILSQELAYIYGVLIGDGCLEYNQKNCRINLNVIDKDFAIYFAKILKKWCRFNPTFNRKKIKKIYHQTKYGNWIKSKKDQYVVRLGSKQIVDFLLTKVNCRTYTWKVPKDILRTRNKKFIAAFLKGIFDSEGSVIYDKKNNKKRIDLRMYGKEVKDLQPLLEKLKIKSTITQSKQDKIVGTFTLRVLDKKSLEIFYNTIGLSIKRKKLILKKILKSYTREPFDADKTRADILSSLKSKSKTIREISRDINKSYTDVLYHLKNFNGKKVKIIRKELKDGIHSSKIWSLI